MRRISSLNGSVALKYSSDEASPDTDVLTRDLVAFIGDTYNFSKKPEVPVGMLANPTHVFQTGVLVIDDKKKIPINQLLLLAGGAILTAKDTDAADIVADHMVHKIDTDFGYKVADSIRARYYQSIIVVEFDPGLERQIAAIERAQNVLNQWIRRPENPFALKRLSFGAGDVELPFNPISIEGFSNSDFTIERRAGERYPLNRYFCSAPLQTREHERVLKLVEEAMRG